MKLAPLLALPIVLACSCLADSQSEEALKLRVTAAERTARIEHDALLKAQADLVTARNERQVLARKLANYADAATATHADLAVGLTAIQSTVGDTAAAADQAAVSAKKAADVAESTLPGIVSKQADQESLLHNLSRSISTGLFAFLGLAVPGFGALLMLWLKLGSAERLQRQKWEQDRGDRLQQHEWAIEDRRRTDEVAADAKASADKAAELIKLHDEWERDRQASEIEARREVARRVDEVSQLAQASADITATKVDYVIGQAKSIHTLVDGQTGVMLKALALSNRRVADLTRSARDIEAAETSEALSRNHEAQQAQVSAAAAVDRTQA